MVTSSFKWFVTKLLGMISITLHIESVKGINNASTVSSWTFILANSGPLRPFPISFLNKDSFNLPLSEIQTPFLKTCLIETVSKSSKIKKSAW